MNKHTAKSIDRQWKETQARKDTLTLAKISHRLISPQELREMFLALKPGQCVVVTETGAIYVGEEHHVKTDKMRKTKDSFKVAEKIDLLRVESDMKSAEEMYPTLGGTKRASNWDTRSRLANGTSPKRGKKVEVIEEVEVF